MPQLAIPAADAEVAFDRRRPHIHGCLDVAAVERIVTDGRDTVIRRCEIGSLTARIEGIASCRFGKETPSSGVKGQRQMRIEVDATHVGGLELRPRTPEMADR